MMYPFEQDPNKENENQQSPAQDQPGAMPSENADELPKAEEPKPESPKADPYDQTYFPPTPPPAPQRPK